MMKAGRPSKSANNLEINSFTESKTKKIQFDTSNELHTRVKMYALKQNITISNLMNDLIEKHIPKDE